MTNDLDTGITAFARTLVDACLDLRRESEESSSELEAYQGFALLEEIRGGTAFADAVQRKMLELAEQHGPGFVAWLRDLLRRFQESIPPASLERASAGRWSVRRQGAHDALVTTVNERRALGVAEEASRMSSGTLEVLCDGVVCYQIRDGQRLTDNDSDR